MCKDHTKAVLLLYQFSARLRVIQQYPLMVLFQIQFMFSDVHLVTGQIVKVGILSGGKLKSAVKIHVHIQNFPEHPPIRIMTELNLTIIGILLKTGQFEFQGSLSDLKLPPFHLYVFQLFFKIHQ